MRKILMIVVAFSILSSAGNAQLWKLRRYELSVGIGTAQSYVDIGGYSKGENALGLKDFTFHNTGFNINSSFKYRLQDDLSARLSLAFGSLHARDVKGSNENRGFESSTFFFEPAIIGEYYFIKNTGDNSFRLMKGKGNVFKSFISMLDFYAFAGFGGLSYNVKPNDLLAPNVSEKSGFTAIIPGGAGINLIYSTFINFGLEFGVCYTFSDNIDGYTSKFSKANDIHHFLNFTFTYKFKTSDKGFPVF